MKFVCSKKKLVQAIQTVSKATASNPQTPILGGICMTAENDTIVLEATDNEIGIRCTIEADVSDNGSIVLMGRTAQDVFRRLPGEDVNLDYSLEEKLVHIKSGPSNYTLLAMDASAFPHIIRIEPQEAVSFTVTNKDLDDLIRRTVPACGTDIRRPVFTGCLLDLNSGSVTMAATDTHRLSIKTLMISEGPERPRKVIIPAKALKEIQHLLASDVPTDIRVSCSPNKITFEMEGIFITNRLIEGQFPDYKRVMPQNLPINVTLNTADFLSAVERVSLVTRQSEYNIIRLSFSGDQVRITAKNPEIGEAKEQVDAKVEGGELDIAFNAAFVTDALQAITGKEFLFQLDKPLSTSIIRETEDTSFLYMITPVRTR